MSKISEKYVIKKLEAKTNECEHLKSRLRDWKEENEQLFDELNKCMSVFEMIANVDTTEIMDNTKNIYISSIWIKPGDKNYEFMKEMLININPEKYDKEKKEDAES